MSSIRLAGKCAALVAVLALFATTALPVSAADAPYTAYGLNQKAGAKIGANIAGKSCGAEVTVDALGNWLMSIASTAACAPREKDVVTFTVDGQAADQTIAWTAGGAPVDPAKGIALTVTVIVKTTTTPMPTATGFSGGTISPTGASIVVFSGTTAQLDIAGSAVKARSVSATVGGKLLTYVVGAPGFVNTDFSGAFSSGLNGTLVIVTT